MRILQVTTRHDEDVYHRVKGHMARGITLTMPPNFLMSCNTSSDAAAAMRCRFGQKRSQQDTRAIRMGRKEMGRYERVHCQYSRSPSLSALRELHHIWSLSGSLVCIYDNGALKNGCVGQRTVRDLGCCVTLQVAEACNITQGQIIDAKQARLMAGHIIWPRVLAKQRTHLDHRTDGIGIGPE